MASSRRSLVEAALGIYRNSLEITFILVARILIGTSKIIGVLALDSLPYLAVGCLAVVLIVR
jgi:hypothetical protein